MSKKVTKNTQIEQDIPIETQRLRVAAYCRVSTRHAEQCHSRVGLILVKSLSRFGRDTLETIRQIRRLKKVNIGVYENGGLDTFTTDFLTGRREKNAGQSDQYLVSNAHEPIIDQVTFELVQRMKLHFFAFHAIIRKNQEILKIMCGRL